MRNPTPITRLEHVEKAIRRKLTPSEDILLLKAISYNDDAGFEPPPTKGLVRLVRAYSNLMKGKS